LEKFFFFFKGISPKIKSGGGRIFAKKPAAHGLFFVFFFLISPKGKNVFGKKKKNNPGTKGEKKKKSLCFKVFSPLAPRFWGGKRKEKISSGSFLPPHPFFPPAKPKFRPGTLWNKKARIGKKIKEKKKTQKGFFFLGVSWGFF